MHAALRILLGILVTLLLLLVGVVGGTVIVLYGDYSVQYPARFRAPDRIGELVHTKDPELLRSERGAVADLRKSGLEQPFASHYVDAANPKIGVFVAGSTQRVLLPRFEVGGALRMIGVPVADRVNVKAGEQGGTVQCGSALVAGTHTVVCVWADHGSMGVVRFMGRSLDEAGSLVAEIRAATIVRG
jgi:hypothetical protein